MHLSYTSGHDVVLILPVLPKIMCTYHEWFWVVECLTSVYE